MPSPSAPRRQIDTLCRQAEARQAASQHASGSGATPQPVFRRSDTGGPTASPLPTRAPPRLQPRLDGPSQTQPHCDTRGRATRAVVPTVPTGPTFDSAGGGAGPNAAAVPSGGTGPGPRSAPGPAPVAPDRLAGVPPNSDAASLAAALREKERQLGEKEAHLKMLRSRLEMAEQDGETARRRLEASRLERERERERERNAAAGASRGAGSHARDGGFAACANADGVGGVGGRFANAPSGAFGPAPTEVSNAAALQEARAELARLRARVAFKEEEAEEARRREDEHVASLRRSEAETARLAAEVRKERRRAAAAEGDAAATAAGTTRRSRAVRPTLPTGAAAALPPHARGDDGDGGYGCMVTAALPALPPAPPVTLVLPPLPASLAVGFLSDLEPAGGAAAFAATVAAAPTAARAVLGFAASSTHRTPLDDRVALAAFRLRDVLSDLAADAAAAATFAAAAADLVVAAAEELEKIDAVDAFDGVAAFDETRFPSRASFLRTVARDAMFAAAAAARSDASAAAELARLLGAAPPSALGRGPRGCAAPRPPPEALAGVPAAGTDGVGCLVPHPGMGARASARVLAPAPPETTPSGGVAEAFSDASATTSRGDDASSFAEKKTAASTPFLSGALVLLSSSLSAGDWYTARSALRLLTRAAAEADPLRGRGVFAVAAAAGHLERALGGDGEGSVRRGSGGGDAPSAAGRSAGADGADAASAATGGGRDADRASGRAERSFAFGGRRASGAGTVARRPPARVRRDALALARLLAATPEFAASLSGGLDTGSPERRARAPSERSKRRRRDDDDDADASNDRPRSEDGDDEETQADCPLLRAVVACVEEFAEEARLSASASSRRREADALGAASAETRDAPARETFETFETFAVEDELEGSIGARASRGGNGKEHGNPETAADAALMALAAISHAGWPGWGDAVRRHGVLSAAVVAAEASFALAARPAASAAPAADQRRLRHALMFVARLLAEPASARAASSALRRDGETCRRLARVARAANAHAEQMPRRVGKYLDSVLAAWA